VAQWKALAAKWFCNHFRLTVNSGYWLQNTGGYKTNITQTVNNMTAAGIIVLFDYHWGAPSSYNGGIGDGQPGYCAMSNDVAFWADVATTFLNNRAVVLELLNEPFGDGNSAGLQYLKNGSGSTQVTFYDQYAGKGGGGPTGSKYLVAGHQQLVNAIRATGSLHVIVYSCPAFCSDINNSLNVKPNDPLNQLAASMHYAAGGGTGPYKTILAAGVSLWMTEYDKSTSLGGMPWMQSVGMGYTVWSVSGNGWSGWGGPGPASWIGISPFSSNNTDVFTGWPNSSPHP
jgi:endoglucanase